MKQFLAAFAFLFLCFFVAKAQHQASSNKKFNLFSQANVNYVFGINESSLDQKTNSLHVKLVIGVANPKTGFGIGLENATFRPAGSAGSRFETLNFTGNVHFLAKPITTDELNYFAKGAVGYAPRIFRGYSKGFNYEVATGIMLTTKRKSKYFLQALYQYQEFDGFLVSGGKPKLKSVGFGVGTWF
ncbi:hypothetical protein [Pedobacter arcticus]|uniref:hypothetical protein n=1 Tax=Pedobacter arcticus TaxID=752140 RepID=UPI0012B5B8C0|nr:hypothetical protein [Pedobacter arcticus]